MINGSREKAWSLAGALGGAVAIAAGLEAITLKGSQRAFALLLKRLGDDPQYLAADADPYLEIIGLASNIDRPMNETIVLFLEQCADDTAVADRVEGDGYRLRFRDDAGLNSRCFIEGDIRHRTTGSGYPENADGDGRGV